MERFEGNEKRFLPGTPLRKLQALKTAKEPEEKHRLVPYLNFGEKKIF